MVETCSKPHKQWDKQLISTYQLGISQANRQVLSRGARPRGARTKAEAQPAACRPSAKGDRWLYGGCWADFMFFLWYLFWWFDDTYVAHLNDVVTLWSCWYYLIFDVVCNLDQLIIAHQGHELFIVKPCARRQSGCTGWGSCDRRWCGMIQGPRFDPGPW